MELFFSAVVLVKADVFYEVDTLNLYTDDLFSIKCELLVYAF